MTKRKRNAVITGIVIVGLAGVLFLILYLFSSASMVVMDDGATEVMFQERLLEYAEFGLFFNEEINGFFYNEQRVRRLVDTPSLFQYDNGIVEITITRNSEGAITDFNVR